MMLEPVPSSIVIRVTAEIRQNEQCRFTGILRLTLYRLPKLGAQAIGTPYTIDIKRIRSRVGDIDVVHGNPQKTGGLLTHQPTHYVQGEFIGAGQRQCMRPEIVD